MGSVHHSLSTSGCAGTKPEHDDNPDEHGDPPHDDDRAGDDDRPDDDDRADDDGGNYDGPVEPLPGRRSSTA